MSSLWHRAERYRYLANESRRLAAKDPYTESQSFHLHMAVLYSTLAEAAELKTTIGRQPCARPNGRRRANTQFTVGGPSDSRLTRTKPQAVPRE
jgi:hypothetical protein